jgi:hypothetical protein
MKETTLISPVSRKVNPGITKRVISLHERGYQFDFEVCDHLNLVCVQTEEVYLKDKLLIRLVDMQFNETSATYTYIHSVETLNGIMGTLLSNSIFCNVC